MFVTVPLNLPLIGYFASMPDHGSAPSCFMPRLMRWVSGLMRTICTFTVSPTLQNLCRVVDALPSHVGDVKQAVDAAEVDEGAVIGDVLDDAVDHLALFELGDDLRALLCARLFENGAARHDDIAAAAIHLQDLEGLRHVHQRRHVLDGTNVHLAAGKEGNGAVEIDGESALDAVKDDAFDLLASVEFLFELRPAVFTAGLLAGEHSFTGCVLDPLDINFHLIADMEGWKLDGRAEFLQRHAAFGLEADIDDGEVFFDGDDLALYDCAFAWGRCLSNSSRRAAKSSTVGLYSLALGSIVWVEVIKTPMAEAIACVSVDPMDAGRAVS